jgi:uncharacterized protein YebE (UPF0316 family)
MWFLPGAQTLLTGIGIFLLRTTDVTLGTIRTIAIVHGRTRVAFVLGFFEVSLWLVAISTVVSKIGQEPVLGVFYALGYATGNVAGIWVERRIASGHTILRVVSVASGKPMAERVREAGYPVTAFEGEGLSGRVTELYVVCRRRDLREILALVKAVDPCAFYITEQAGSVSKITRPVCQEGTGWRGIIKKK